MAIIEELRFAQEFGFTPEYTRSLDMFDRNRIWGFLDGFSRLRKDARR